MTGAEIVTALESIGAVVELTEAGVVNVDAPAVPELSLLVAEAKAHRAEVVAELKRHVALALPGRAERPCLACGRRCPEGVLFDTLSCFETWKGRRLPGVTRTATGPARNIPPEDDRPGGAG